MTPEFRTTFCHFRATPFFTGTSAIPFTFQGTRTRVDGPATAAVKTSKQNWFPTPNFPFHYYYFWIRVLFAFVFALRDRP
ncbi:hypothetical protein NDU88_005601 [Pleurodeles waltl]|uniref:Uncharacterized protein n=1 Tax=Pleurodeles waltl TaxID=8319 RepID=A0AAV7TV95_PLEWA|nr:hypothetical protein NDU88_005601 [Pleurodeles waltl]